MLRSCTDGLSIKRADLPGVVVIDPSMSEYYDTTIEGSKISFDGASIFSVLEGFYQHFLRPKRSETALEWGSRSATMTLITTGVSISSFSTLSGRTGADQVITAMGDGPSLPCTGSTHGDSSGLCLVVAKMRLSGSSRTGQGERLWIWGKGLWASGLGLDLPHMIIDRCTISRE